MGGRGECVEVSVMWAMVTALMWAMVTALSRLHRPSLATNLLILRDLLTFTKPLHIYFSFSSLKIIMSQFAY